MGRPAKRSPTTILKTIKQPTVVVNGSNDVIMPSVNSFIMQQNMPNAQLIIYPDSNHGAHHILPRSFSLNTLETLFLRRVTTACKTAGVTATQRE